MRALVVTESHHFCTSVISVLDQLLDYRNSRRIVREDFANADCEVHLLPEVLLYFDVRHLQERRLQTVVDTQKKKIKILNI